MSKNEALLVRIGEYGVLQRHFHGWPCYSLLPQIETVDLNFTAEAVVLIFELRYNALVDMDTCELIQCSLKAHKTAGNESISLCLRIHMTFSQPITNKPHEPVFTKRKFYGLCLCDIS
jgi:hypothetical protein